VVVGTGVALALGAILISGSTEDTMRFITNVYPAIALIVQVALPAATHIALFLRDPKGKHAKSAHSQN
jgi:hypothetical protein